MNNFDIDPTAGHTYFTAEELANEPVNPMDCTEETYKFIQELGDVLAEIFEGMDTEIAVMCQDMKKHECGNLTLAKEYLRENSQYYADMLVDHIVEFDLDEI